MFDIMENSLLTTKSSVLISPESSLEITRTKKVVIFDFPKFIENRFPEWVLDCVLNHKFTEKFGIYVSNMSFTSTLVFLTLGNFARDMVTKYRGKTLPLPYRGVELSSRTELKAHQISSLRWMMNMEETSNNGIRGGMLCSEMGLGKTLTMLCHIMSYSKGEFPTLVVAPKSGIRTWKEQILKFFGSRLKVFFLHPDYDRISKEGVGCNQITTQQIKKYDIVVTAYGICRRNAKPFVEVCYEYSITGKKMAVNLRTRSNLEAVIGNYVGVVNLFKIPWERVVFDESQDAANSKTITFEACMALVAKKRWSLTGTPLVNQYGDIWSQLRIVGFDEIPYSRSWKKGWKAHMEKYDIRRNMMIHTREGIGMKLPPMYKRAIIIDLTVNERKVYRAFRGATDAAIEEFKNYVSEKGVSTFAHVLAIFMKWRQCCVSAHLVIPKKSENIKKWRGRKVSSKFIEDDEDLIVGDGENNQSLIKISENDKQLLPDISQDKTLLEWCNDEVESGFNSSKILSVIDIIKGSGNRKILLFSSFSSLLEMLVYALKFHLPDIKVHIITGKIIGSEREKVLESFNHDNYKIILCSYKACSTSLNITVASINIKIEPWWNFAVTSQADARSYRAGQTQDVYSYDIIADGTIENEMMNVSLLKKLKGETISNGLDVSVPDYKLNVDFVEKLLSKS